MPSTFLAWVYDRQAGEIGGPLTPVCLSRRKLQLPGFYGFAMWFWGRLFFKPHPRWNVQQISMWRDKGKTGR